MYYKIKTDTGFNYAKQNDQPFNGEEITEAEYNQAVNFGYDMTWENIKIFFTSFSSIDDKN